MPVSSTRYSGTSVPGRPPREIAGTARWWRSWGAPLAVLGGGLSVIVTLCVALAAATRREIDFEVYRMGAAHVLGSDLYQLRLPHKNLPFTYPPFAALIFRPFAAMSLSAGKTIWSLLNVAELLALIAVSLRAVRPGWPAGRLWAVSAIALLPAQLLNPVLTTLFMGQVNLLLALLVLADLTLTLRAGPVTVPRGVLLGIAAAIKLTPLIFIPFLLLTRRPRVALTGLAAFAGCGLAAFAAAPRASREYWSDLIARPGRSGNLVYVSNQNLSAAVSRVLAHPPPALLLGALTLAVAIGGMAVAVLVARDRSPLAGALLCAATALAVSPVSWSHHYVWIVPALAWLALAPDRPRGGPWIALGAAALFWAAPIWWIPNPQRATGGPAILLEGNSFFLAALAFLLTGAWSLRARLRPGPADALAAQRTKVPR